MTISGEATSSCKKLMKLGLSIFRRGFSSSKCKTMAKMAMARIKLLRNKREAVVRQMRRDIALLLQSGQDATARIRVEHVIREQNILAANEFLELFCELIIARLTIISKQRDCPADLKEGISSLIFAAPRCSDIPELLAIRDNFEKKYGKDFVSAATDLRPSCGVNRMLIDKLSVRTPMGEVKLKVMKEIAKEYQIEWDTTESENELLKPPEELINGPCTFVSASSMPVKPKPSQPSDLNKPTARSTGTEERPPMHFKDMESAAEAAAESANKAIAAAQAAAYLANKGPNLVTQSPGFNNNLNVSSTDHGLQSYSQSNMGYEAKIPGRMHESQSFDRSHHLNTEERRPNNGDNRQAYRRHSYNAPSAHSNIKFDESDSDEEIETQDTYAGIQPPPGRDPPPIPPSHFQQSPVPSVHPKLPDYDALTARFEALKYRKS